jgi:hypothetical protein
MQGTNTATPTTTGANLAAGLGMFIARKDGASETFPLTDHLGSVVALTDINGAVLTRFIDR